MAAQPTIAVPASLLQGFVNFIEKSGGILSRVQQDRTQTKEAAPTVVDTLVKMGLLDEGRKAAAVDALSGSHVKTLEVLRRTADRVAPPSLGQGEDMSKSASVDDKDARFLKALGF